MICPLFLDWSCCQEKLFSNCFFLVLVAFILFYKNFCKLFYKKIFIFKETTVQIQSLKWMVQCHKDVDKYSRVRLEYAYLLFNKLIINRINSNKLPLHIIILVLVYILDDHKALHGNKDRCHPFKIADLPEYGRFLVAAKEIHINSLTNDLIDHQLES